MFPLLFLLLFGAITYVEIAGGRTVSRHGEGFSRRDWWGFYPVVTIHALIAAAALLAFLAAIVMATPLADSRVVSRLGQMVHGTMGSLRWLVYAVVAWIVCFLLISLVGSLLH